MNSIRVLVHVVKLADPVFQEVDLRLKEFEQTDFYLKLTICFKAAEGERLREEEGLRATNPYATSTFHKVTARIFDT